MDERTDFQKKLGRIGKLSLLKARSDHKKAINCLLSITYEIKHLEVTQPKKIEHVHHKRQKPSGAAPL
jgi:hypothetical protein